MSLGGVLTAAGVGQAKLAQFQVFKFFPLFSFPFPFVFSPNPQNPDPARPEGQLQKALNDAIAQLETSPHTFPIPCTIADINSGQSNFPAAHFKGDEIDFIASEAKVAALYAAFRLRAMVRNFAKLPGITKDNLFGQLAKFADQDIIADGPLLKSGEDMRGNSVAVKDEHRKPKYKDMFKVTSGTSGLEINFIGAQANDENDPDDEDKKKKWFTQLRDMIVSSNDVSSGKCIHGIGYSFLNGALSEGSFFNSFTDTGLWLAADYVGQYPKVRGVMSVNDGTAAIAGTTTQMARLVAMIAATDAFGDIDPEAKMFEFLHDAATPGVAGFLRPWASFGQNHNPPQETDAIPEVMFTLNKLGIAPLGHHEEGPSVLSEASVIEGVPLKPGKVSKKYVVAWQNLQLNSPFVTTEVQSGVRKITSSVIPTLIRKTLLAYEA